MAVCQASVLVGRTTKPIDVLFSSGAEISYISQAVTRDLGLSPSLHDTTVTIEDVFGRKDTFTHAAAIDLSMGTFRCIVNAFIVPGNLFCLVLGIDWLRKHNVQLEMSEEAFLITDESGAKHAVRMKKLDLDIPIVSSLRVISRTPNQQSKPKTSKSRYRLIKDGWGNRPNFQASYGLSMTPEDIEEGNRILEALEEAETEELAEEASGQAHIPYRTVR